MNLMEFKGELEKLDIPIQFRAFQVGHAPSLPYLIFYEDDSDNFMADNHNYYDVLNIVCELYTDEKDVELETKLQKLFYDNEIGYNTQETYIDSENMYLKTYNIVIAYDSLADVQEKEVDKTNLKLLIDYAETLDADAYEDASFNELQTVLAYAKAVLIDSETTQTEVDEIEQDLMVALNGLITLKIDKTQLKGQIDYAKTLAATDYDRETFNSLKIALADAETVYVSDNAKQSDANRVLIMLLLAIQALEVRNDEEEFYKGVNLYAPLFWKEQGFEGEINELNGEVKNDTWKVRSEFIKIPDLAYELTGVTQGSDSFYIIFYNADKKYVKYEYFYNNGAKTINIQKKAKYIRISSYKQTPSSVLINKIKIEFGEKTEWTIAPEDEQYMKLELI